MNILPGMALGVQRLAPIRYKHYGIYAGEFRGLQCVIHYSDKLGGGEGRIPVTALCATDSAHLAYVGRGEIRLVSHAPSGCWHAQTERSHFLHRRCVRPYSSWRHAGEVDAPQRPCRAGVGRRKEEKLMSGV